MATREHGGTASTYGQRVYLEWDTSETGDTYTISTKVGLQAYTKNISISESGIFPPSPWCTVESNVTPINYSDRYFENKKDLPFTLSRGSSALFLARTFKFNKTHSARTVKINATSIMEALHIFTIPRWKDDGTETGDHKVTTENESVFLKSFSIPARTSYTLTFNKNGGTGTNFTKTKWHGESITLPSNPFTRVGYRFVGWGTSSTGSATYSENGAYNGNATTTLYAIWQSTYVAPTITNLTAMRAKLEGGAWSDDDEGEKLHVKFNYTVGTEDGNELPQTFKVGYKKTSASSYTYVTVTGADGLVDQYVDVQIDSADPYDIRAVIEVGQQTGGPAHSNVTRNTYVSPVYFAIDVNEDGTGIAFGKSATRTGFECDMMAYFNRDVQASGDISDGSGNVLSDIKQYTTGTVSTSSATSISSGGYETITINASKTGYTPVGVLTINKSGANQGRSFVSNWYFDGNNLKAGVYNTASANASISLTATILYVKA